MEEQIFQKNQSLKILPDVVEEAGSVHIKEIVNKKIYITSIKNSSMNFREIEVFSITEQGIMYFVSVLHNENNELYIDYPDDYKLLQRRKYTRLPYEKEMEFSYGAEKISARITDISGGGMRVKTSKELLLGKDYEFKLELDKNKIIDLIYSPIRVNFDNNEYTVSGRFKIISNLDRISLAQFCFKKQMENTNK